MTQNEPQYLSFPLFEEGRRLELELLAGNDDYETRVDYDVNLHFQKLWAKGEHQVFGVYSMERPEDNFDGLWYVCWCGLVFEWPFHTDAPLEDGWADLPGHRNPDGSPCAEVHFKIDGIEYVSGVERDPEPEPEPEPKRPTVVDPTPPSSYHPNAFRIQRLAFNPTRFLAEATGETDPEEIEALQRMIHLQERRAHGHMGFGACSCFAISPLRGDGSLPTGREVMHGGVHIDPVDKTIGIKVFVVETEDGPAAFTWFCQECGKLPEPAVRNAADTDWEPITHGGHTWPLRNWLGLGQPTLDH